LKRKNVVKLVGLSVVQLGNDAAGVMQESFRSYAALGRSTLKRGRRVAPHVMLLLRRIEWSHAVSTARYWRLRLQESLREEHNRLVADNVRLTEEAAALRERYEAMQASCSMLTRDKADLAAKLEAATTELAALRSGTSAAAATTAAHAAELESLRADLAKMHGLAEGAKVSGAGGLIW
jgi:septal ring factor EnvC (AmiA/AmiB activator)